MRAFLLLPLIQAEIICNFDEPCLKACTDTVCEYFWNVEHRFTRTWRTKDFGEGRSYDKGALRDFPIEWNSTKGNFDIIQEGINKGVDEVFDENGNVKNPLEELENLFLVDGQPERKVITINGQLPGPKIIVNKGALVKITVKSTLHEESFTIHWHGLHQVDNYWNDGAAMISQCPVDANQEFTYVMRAENSGTHWYHSHYGMQRADGLHGAFIILEDGEDAEEMSWITMILTDWWKVDSTHMTAADPYRYGNTLGARMTGPGKVACTTEDKSFLAGVKLSGFCVDSVIANGRGQYRRLDSDEKIKEDNFEFSVAEEYLVSETTKRIQLKTAHAGFEFPLLFRAVDGRKVTVTAHDGRRTLPDEGDGVFIGVAETLNIEVDFPVVEKRLELIVEIMFEGLGKTARPLERPFVKIIISRDASVSGYDVKSKLVAAFEDAEIPEAFGLHQDNSVEEKLLLNCPAKRFVDIPCKTVLDFKRDPDYESRFDDPPHRILSETPDRVIQLNMNFATGAAINGIEFKYPEEPFFDGPENTPMNKCTAEQMQGAGGHCTQMIEVQKDELIEFRVTAAENILNQSRRWQWTYHSIHLHGYEYFVTDVGFGTINQTTGFIEATNPSFRCKNNGIRCMHVEFDELMLQQKRSGRKNTDFIAKNTVVVPAMGYVVFRLRATNPGIWPFHCHQLFHNYEGMAVALYVKDEVDNKPFSYLPKNMPRCHNYHPKDIAINEEPQKFPEDEESSACATMITILFLILPICLF